MKHILFFFLKKFILPTRGFNAVDECLHLFVTLGLVCVEIGSSTDNPPTPVPKPTVRFVFLLTMINT